MVSGRVCVCGWDGEWEGVCVGGVSGRAWVGGG